MNQVFVWRLLGDLEYENAFIYTMFALFLSIVFIIHPAGKNLGKDGVPWYDAILFVFTFLVSAYLAIRAYEITHQGWDLLPPKHVGLMALYLCLASLEAIRRVGGKILFITCFIFALYPSFAAKMPGLLEGAAYSLWDTIIYHGLSVGSLLGLTTRIFGNLLVGFMFFGVVLVATGGGKFFFDISMAFFGTRRGGPAKVAMFASGFFGSISGSVIANVLTTGTVTIPAMKRVGYPAYQAAAIEACASAGGTLMPPIMGAVAFIMAAWLNISYFEVALAAAIPSLLYYFTLFLQVDAYAAIKNLKGLHASEIPSMKEALKTGWHNIIGLLVLIFFMYFNRETQAPFIASAVVIIAAMTKKATRLKKGDFSSLFEQAAQVLSMVLGIMAGIGFIIGSFAGTGLGAAFSSEIGVLAGNNLILILIFGALGSFVLGMGMTVAACYIFLAIVIAPALVNLGINPVAAHLYLIYWGVASYITPPVALGAYTASAIAQTSPTKTALYSMQFGIAKYLLPVFFILNPALVLQTPIAEVIIPLISNFAGLYILTGGLTGYLLFFGRINIIQRMITFLSGFLLAMPGLKSNMIGLGLFALFIILRTINRERVLSG